MFFFQNKTSHENDIRCLQLEKKQQEENLAISKERVKQNVNDIKNMKKGISSIKNALVSNIGFDIIYTL